MLDDRNAPGNISSRPVLVRYRALNITDMSKAQSTNNNTSYHIMLICSTHTHGVSYISVTFLLSCILCYLNTNTHNQMRVSEPLYSQTGLSACSWVTIRSSISDNIPIYQLWNSSKGLRSIGCLWCAVCVKRHGAWRNTLLCGGVVLQHICHM